MPDVRVTIDGTEGSVPAGITVLEACRKLGVEVPTLCDHPAIEPIGACRICLVEVEKQRALQPACTFPVSDGMVVHTRSDRVVDARRFVLQLLFSERNHFCMFCQMSGSCELQDLAYDYGLDHWEFDRAFPRMGVDASREFFVMDHNRCILCRRCVRVCDELVGNATLGVKHRGAETMIIADMDVPFGESSCISCGTCLQVCPTGALGDRASAYMGATDEITRVKSTCIGCSVGCGVELVVRQGRVIRVEGDWDAAPSDGLLCEIGRFGLQHDKRRRARQPQVRQGDGWVDATWDDALSAAAKGLAAAGGELSTLVSGTATNEMGAAIAAKLPGTKQQLGTVLLDDSAGLAALDEADLFVVVGTDLTVEHQVASFSIKRGVRHRGARLMLVCDGDNGLAPWAFKQVGLNEAASVLDIIKGAEQAVVVYDAKGSSVAKAIAEAVPGAKCVAFTDGANTKGLAAAGVAEAFAGGAKAYLVVAGEETGADESVMAALGAADFVAVQASYAQPWADVADVILPMPTMWEKSGTVISADGVEREVRGAVAFEGLSDVTTIERLGALLS